MDIFYGDIYWMNLREDLEYMNFADSFVANMESVDNVLKSS